MKNKHKINIKKELIQTFGSNVVKEVKINMLHQKSVMNFLKQMDDQQKAVKYCSKSFR